LFAGQTSLDDPYGDVTVNQADASGAIGVALPRYVAIGVLTVAIDISLLALLHSAAGVALVPATLIAYTVSLVFNYSLNHVWAFGADGLVWTRLARYAVLVAINLGLTLAIITGLTSLEVYYLLAKVIAVAVGASINFVGYRKWVFR
jgi:putative flippase GtrA